MATRIPENMSVPDLPVGFPPSFLACPDCSWIMHLQMSGVTSHYQCSYGCRKRWTFQRIPWHHPHFDEIQRQFTDISTRILFGTSGEEWPSGMQSVIFQCMCCGVGKVGWWTPEATSGFYILSAWPDKRPRIMQIMRAHGGYESDRDDAFLCDDCASHPAEGEVVQ